MYSSFATSRRSGSSGTFTVRTGGEHFIPVHAPLGRTVVKKPITPVPPYYVTEYESTFRWPPGWAYATACVNCAKAASSCAHCDSKGNEKTTAGPAPAPKNWQSLHDAVTRLQELNYENDLMNALKEPVTQRRLSLAMEYVNSWLVDTIAAVELHRAENGVYPEVPSKDVLDLCKQFTSAVRAIKAC